MKDTAYLPVISKFKDIPPFEMDEGVNFHEMIIHWKYPQGHIQTFTALILLGYI